MELQMILTAFAFAVATTTAPIQPEVDVCMRAAAAVAHTTVKDADQDGCVCTVQQLHKYLAPGDYQLHEAMEEIIASGADEKSFNTQLSAIMLKRGMNQAAADAFLTRSHAAEIRAAAFCNPSSLLEQ